MKRRSYFVFAAIALGWAAGLNAQQSVGQTSVSSVVSCVSKGRERQQCPADTRAGIVMLRPTGEAACLLGRNWGYDDQGVWVSEGCGGDFGTGSSSRATAPAALGAALAYNPSKRNIRDGDGYNRDEPCEGLHRRLPALWEYADHHFHSSQRSSGSTRRRQPRRDQFRNLWSDQGNWHHGMGGEPRSERNHAERRRNHVVWLRRGAASDSTRLRCSPWIFRCRYSANLGVSLLASSFPPTTT